VIKSDRAKTSSRDTNSTPKRAADSG
jgi:hypothetical protein